jgi:hypothetical protein
MVEKLLHLDQASEPQVTVSLTVDARDMPALREVLTEAARGINEAASDTANPEDRRRLRVLAGRLYAAVQA